MKKFAVQVFKKISGFTANPSYTSKSKTGEDISTSSTPLKRSTLKTTKSKTLQPQKQKTFVLQPSDKSSSDDDSNTTKQKHSNSSYPQKI